MEKSEPGPSSAPKRKRLTTKENLKRKEAEITRLQDEIRRLREDSHHNSDEGSVNLRDATPIKMGLSEVSTLIPLFDPGNKNNMTASAWIENIDGLQLLYSWESRMTILYASLRLDGAARHWYNSQKSNLRSWDQFKSALLESFPGVQEESSILLQIMTRRYEEAESIESYFYSIVSMAKSINFSDENTMKYIISGLGDKSRMNALSSAKCSTLNELLKLMKKQEEIAEQGRRREQLYSAKQGREINKYRRYQPYQKNKVHEQGKNKTQGKVKCYRCNELGHFANKCTSKEKLCFKCNKPGHISKECMQETNKLKVRKVATIVEDEYHPEIKVGGVTLRAFIDLGSECTIIKESLVKKNKWKVEPCQKMLVGFGGGSIRIDKKIRETVQVYGQQTEIELVVVPDEHQDIDVIIGKNFLDRPEYRIIKEFGRFIIERVTEPSTATSGPLDLVTEEKKRPEKDDIKLEDVEVDKTNEEQQIENLMSILNKHKDCVARSLKELGHTEVEEMKITLKESKIVRYQPYKVAYGLKEKLRQHIDELLELKIIRPSTSEYASPVIMVPKKEGDWRMCVDYRRLNSITKRDYYPTPNIEETLNSLAGRSIFTTVDLMSGYYQIPIAEDSKHLTAFVTADGHYEFERIPFGLTNSPATFQRTISKILTPIADPNINMDDILIATSNIKENLDSLNRLLLQFIKTGLTINLKKCKFLSCKIKFLGHEIDKEGVRPGENKTAAVEQYKRPTNAREVKQFLGLAGYFRRFVLQFAQLARPLNNVLKKGEPFVWTEEMETSFNNIKRALTQRPVLTLYEASAEHELHTDASSHGLAGILMQKGKDGMMKVVSYFSRATTPLESKYHSYELEALAVVESLERFKHYLLYKHFTVVTDCSSLKMTKEKKDLVPRIARWWLRIAEYDFDLVHKSATQLAHADSLSRAPVEKGKDCEPVSEKLMTIGIHEEDWMSTLQSQDEYIQMIRRVLMGTEGKKGEVEGIKGGYTLEGERLYKITSKGKKFVVPSGLRWKILKTCHDESGHCGEERTMTNIEKYFWFKNMRPTVKKYINCCIDCLYNKKGKDENKYQIFVPELRAIPFYKVHIDHMGPYPKSKAGNQYLIGVIDSFTKFLILRAVRSTNTRGVIRLLDETTQYFGLPIHLVSDRGSAFTSKEFKKYCHENVINHTLTTVQTPRSNGQIERYFRTVKNAISAMTQRSDGKDWDEHLPAIQQALNSMISNATKSTPQELLMAYKPRNQVKNKLVLALQVTDRDINIDDEEEPLSIVRERVLQHMNAHKQKVAEAFNNKKQPPKRYDKGDLVLVRYEAPATGESRKVMPRYRGPYEIHAVLDNDRYVIKDTAQLQVTQKPYESIQAADRLKPWCLLEDFDWDEEDEAEINGENE